MYLKKCISAMTAGVLVVSCLGLSGCGPEDTVSKVSEEELTAVRQALIDNTEITGLSTITSMEFYENGVRIAGDKMNIVRDNHKIYYTDSGKRVIDYADGYQFDLPLDWVPDYSLSAYRARYSTDDVVLTVSREEAVNEPNSKDFIDKWMNDAINDAGFRKANKITRISETTLEIGKYKCEVIKSKIEGMAADRLAYYTHATFYNDNSMRIYRLVFKSKTEMDFSAILNSFQTTSPQGKGVNNLEYKLNTPDTWSQETKDYYSSLQTSDEVDWGLFCGKMETTGYDKTIPTFEKKMEYTFPVVSQYLHYGWNGKEIPFPTEWANKVAADGRVLQLSYQYTDNNNGDVKRTYTPTLDVYRGTEAAISRLRNLAKSVKAYGKPLLFRLNNEMNTDWTSYCGMVTMGDPDIFIDSWITLYNIFQEEGVDNAIWIFNAFDNSLPPGNWSNYLNYLPPSKYVNMIGLTGYNKGTANSGWQSFQTIYDNIKTDYDQYFAEWPWIISEFGCGYDYAKVSEAEMTVNPSEDAKQKAKDEYLKQTKWVEGMFDNFEQNRYPNIKVAIWFSANDYNEDHVVTNPFSLDIASKETITAFKDGFARTHK